MGLKDHPDHGTGHVLSLELDLDYLHVESAQHRLSLRSGPTEAPASELKLGVDVPRPSSDSSSSSSSRCSSSSCTSSSNCSEHSAVSDSEDEFLHNASAFTRPQNSSSLGPSPALIHSPGELLPPVTSEPPSEVDRRSKVEFALKLGYAEELVLLVLRKLGSNALINDILGELVKLGAKNHGEPPAGGASFIAQSPFSSLSFSTDSCKILCTPPAQDDKENLRPVVVDGSNVAMSHGNKEVFSCQGIQLAVDWFLERGHRDVTVFVPAWRKEQSRPDALISDQEILRRLEKEKILVFTPSRRVQGRRVVCYDDRFIIKLAHESDGIIVSNDNYRDLANEKPEWKRIIDERLLMYSFVNDKFMPPDDPLGRHGPSLDNFLRKRPVIPENRKQPCPYGKKCTYGHKCKFYHPERGMQPQRAVADELRASAKSSSSASRNLLGHVQMATNHSLTKSQVESEIETEPHRGLSKKPSVPSPCNLSFSNFLDDRLFIRAKVEDRRGSCSSSCSHRLLLGHTAPGERPSWGSQDRWDPPGGGGGGRSMAAGASGPIHAEIYSACHSPELALGSLGRAYSSQSLVVPKSPEQFFPADMRVGSLLSYSSSEASISSNSFSPDPLLEDSCKCHHRHHHNHNHPQLHHHCPSRYPHPANKLSLSLSKHPARDYSLPQPLRGPPAYATEDPPSSHPSPSSCPFKPPLPYPPTHIHPSSLGGHLGFAGEHSGPPLTPLQTSTAHSQSQSSALGHDTLGSLWQVGRLPNPRLFEGSHLHSRRDYPSVNQKQQQHVTSCDPRYQQPPQTCYEPFTFQSLPEGLDKAWHSPWTEHTNSSPPNHHPLSPNHPSHLTQQPLATASGPQPPALQLQESPVLSHYQDLRDKVFVNLSNIFPLDLVRLVMVRNPHVTDAQQLAAAILMEKSQRGY